MKEEPHVPVTLPTLLAEIMRIEVQGQPWEKVLQTQSQLIAGVLVLTCQTSNDGNCKLEHNGPGCPRQKVRPISEKN
jgi:hypothetical protein